MLNAPNEGESRMLETIVNKTAAETLTLKLFGNNITPGEADTAATYTEVSGGGYAAKTMTGANWTAANGSNSYITHSAQTFSFTGATTPNTVYGYYLVQSTSNRVMWAERFSDGPYAINNNGDSITITARLELEG